MNIDHLMLRIQKAQSEDSLMKRDEINIKREERVLRKRASLGLTYNAQVIRSDAQDTQTQGQAGAAAAGLVGASAMLVCTILTEMGKTLAIGSCANAIPIIGQIIMVLCMIIALCIMIRVMIEVMGAEQEAAAEQRKADEEDLEAEELDADVDDLQDARSEGREQVQGFIQTYLQQQAEHNELLRDSLE